MAKDEKKPEGLAAKLGQKLTMEDLVSKPNWTRYYGRTLTKELLAELEAPAAKDPPKANG